MVARLFHSAFIWTANLPTGTLCLVFADAALAQRLDTQSRGFFRGLASAVSECGIGPANPYLETEGSFAFFAGENSPLTQGAGAFCDEDLEAISRFYSGHARSWEAVVTPFSGPEPLRRLVQRGGAAQGWESVLVRESNEPLTEWKCPIEIEVVELKDADLEAWTRITMIPFSGGSMSGVGQTLGQILQRATNFRRYLALWNGEPVGAASLTPVGSVCLLGGMTTEPLFRGRGIQTALIRKRIEDARQHGDLVTIGATPNSSSHRNAERAGFRVAFSQLSVRVPVP